MWSNTVLSLIVWLVAPELPIRLLIPLTTTLVVLHLTLSTSETATTRSDQ